MFVGHAVFHACFVELIPEGVLLIGGGLECAAAQLESCLELGDDAREVVGRVLGGGLVAEEE